MRKTLSDVFDQQKICDGIRTGYESADVSLYRLINCWRVKILRRVRDDSRTEDVLHDCWIMVRENIRCGNLTNPMALFGYVNTICLRRAYWEISSLAAKRNRELNIDSKTYSFLRDTLAEVDASVNPELLGIQEEQNTALSVCLNALKATHKELLVRTFYGHQPDQQISDEMGLTRTQVRLSKNRAKTFLITMYRYYIQHGALPQMGKGARHKRVVQSLRMAA